MSKNVSASYLYYSCYLRLINRKLLAEVNDAIINSCGVSLAFYVFSEIDNPINSVVENSVLKSLEVVISEVQR